MKATGVEGDLGFGVVEIQDGPLWKVRVKEGDGLYYVEDVDVGAWKIAEDFVDTAWAEAESHWASVVRKRKEEVFGRLFCPCEQLLVAQL